jgi:hypothetical protein
MTVIDATHDSNAIDLTLARKVPLVASDFETQGRAMLSFKYKWD